ncbi:hypothetical protein EON67_01440 [archaeon]|nr:MAG: hypothetical protein EON67_01440 [archaeon]
MDAQRATPGRILRGILSRSPLTRAAPAAAAALFAARLYSRQRHLYPRAPPSPWRARASSKVRRACLLACLPAVRTP